MPELYDDPVKQRIAHIIGELAPLPTTELRRGMRLEDELGYDSLTVVELMFEFERVFGLEPLPEDAAAEASTVDEVVALLLPHVQTTEHAS